MLTFGKNVVSVTKEEYDTLVNRYNDYVDETGVNFGFVKSLLENSAAEEEEESDDDDTVFEMPQ